MTSARSGCLFLISSAARFTATCARAALSEPAKSLSGAGAAGGLADGPLGGDVPGVPDGDVTAGGFDPGDGGGDAGCDPWARRLAGCRSLRGSAAGAAAFGFANSCTAGLLDESALGATASVLSFAGALSRGAAVTGGAALPPAGAALPPAGAALPPAGAAESCSATVACRAG